MSGIAVAVSLRRIGERQGAEGKALLTDCPISVVHSATDFEPHHQFFSSSLVGALQLVFTERYSDVGRGRSISIEAYIEIGVCWFGRVVMFEIEMEKPRTREEAEGNEWLNLPGGSEAGAKRGREHVMVHAGGGWDPIPRC